MKTIAFSQGTPEWHAYRATHYNASDAPAMMGVSPYETRDALIARLATGVTKEIDAATQRRFDEGHRLEALGRAKAEEILRQLLFPIVGEFDSDPRLSASFDGVTLDADINFEHKMMNESLRNVFELNDKIPEIYYVQCQHQMLVGGMDSTMFMAGEMDDGEYWCSYTYIAANKALQSEIVAGWNQLEKDVAAYKANPPAPKAAKPTGVAPESAMSLTLQVRGEVVACNVPEFRAHAIAKIEAINRVMVTDQDFADAESAAKWCEAVETRIKEVKASAIGQQATIEEAFRVLDDVNALVQRTRIDLTNAVKTEKIARRTKIATRAQQELAAHVASLDQLHLAIPLVYFHDAMKSLKTLESCQSKVNDALAKAKVQASADAARLAENVDYFRANSVGFDGLFPDFAQLVQKSHEDFANVVHARIAKHKEAIAAQVEAARLKAERDATLAAEREQARIEQARVAVEEKAARDIANQAIEREREQSRVESANAPDVVVVDRYPQPLRLETIQHRLGIAITHGDLARLGFETSTIAFETDVYHANEFGHICDALVRRVLAAKSNAGFK